MAEAEIAHGGGRRFPELLRFRYEADREGPRLQELHKLTKLAVFMYTACALLIHMLLYARFSVPVLICQILVVVPLLVLLNWRLVRPGLPGFWREAGVVVVSFAAVSSEFTAIKTGPPEQRILKVALVAVTLFLSWLMTHVTFALRYAHEFYAKDNGGPDVDRGLEFPGEKSPDYLDFLYFSLVLGMTFQVSDVTITSRKFRRVATLHGLVGFLFNTVIVAFTVNIAAGLM